jgi:hypothetical protein
MRFMSWRIWGASVIPFFEGQRICPLVFGSRDYYWLFVWGSGQKNGK